MASLFGIGIKSGVEPLVNINLPDHVKYVKMKDIDSKTKEKTTRQLPLFVGEDFVKGEVEIRLNSAKKLEHMGIKIELIGQIDVTNEKVVSSNFMSLGNDLEPSGTLYDDKVYQFKFDYFQKPYESYYGADAKLRYLLRCTIQRGKLQKNIVKELDIAVYTYKRPDKEDQPISMDVGIDTVLAVSLNFPRSVYHLKDVVEGSIKFALVKLKIKSMSLAIKRKETLGSGVNSQTKEEQLMCFEIMDGCPPKEETIPVRLYLACSDQLGPSYHNVNNKFSVQYFLHLLIIDVEDMKYFKNNEIFLYRQQKANSKEDD